MPWAWDPRVRRYRDTDDGRYIGRAKVIAWAEQSIGATSVASDQLAGFAASGSLSGADFGALFKEQIKRAYIRAYLPAAGGRDQMTKADWGRIGGMLAEQYRHLPGFIADIESGKLTDAQIMARARMYINSAREGFEKAKAENAQALGMLEEKWVIDPLKENCPDCLANEAAGWQKVGTFPKPGMGATICLTACGCHLAYRNPDTGATYEGPGQ